MNQNLIFPIETVVCGYPLFSDKPIIVQRNQYMWYPISIKTIWYDTYDYIWIQEDLGQPQAVNRGKRRVLSYFCHLCCHFSIIFLSFSTIFQHEINKTSEKLKKTNIHITWGGTNLYIDVSSPLNPMKSLKHPLKHHLLRGTVLFHTHFFLRFSLAAVNPPQAEHC